MNQTFAASCFSSDAVLLANSVDDDIRGQLMGFRQSTSGLARALGAVLGGIVFAACFRLIPKPGNVLVPWFFLAFVMCIFSVIAWTCIDEKLNYAPSERRKSLNVPLSPTGADMAPMLQKFSDKRQSLVSV